MGYGDDALRFATAELVPNGGATPGALGGTSITGVATTPYTIDMSQNNALGIGIDDIASSELELAVTVDTAFTAGPNLGLEVRIVSIQLLPSLLSNATTAGKLLQAAAPGDTGTDDFTLANHGLPVGAPLYFSALSTLTGISTSVLYFAIPTTANEFQIATSLANAVAGTPINLGGTNGTATMVVMPYIHATTGTMSASALKSGVRHVGKFMPWVMGGLGDRKLPTGQTQAQPIGAAFQPTKSLGGGGSGGVAQAVQVPGRYLGVQILPIGGTMGTGTITVDVGINLQSSVKHFLSGSEVR